MEIKFVIEHDINQDDWSCEPDYYCKTTEIKTDEKTT